MYGRSDRYAEPCAAIFAELLQSGRKSVQEKQERQVAEKQDSRVEASRAANVTKGDNDKAVKKVVSSMQTEKNKATTKAKKPSIHERLEINKRKIQEKQGKDELERGADRDVRTV